MLDLLKKPMIDEILCKVCEEIKISCRKIKGYDDMPYGSAINCIACKEEEKSILQVEAILELQEKLKKHAQ